MTKHSDQGIDRSGRGEEQPEDKTRAQTVHSVDPDKSVSHEATRDPRLSDHPRRQGREDAPDAPKPRETGRSRS